MNSIPPRADTPQSLSGTRWQLDPSTATAEFRVPHFWGLITVKGKFTRLDGYLEVAGDRIHQIVLTIDAASLSTGNRRRDKHLRSGDFFDTDNHPEVGFRSQTVEKVNDRLRVQGQLEAAGRRVVVTLEPLIHQTVDVLDMSATTTVDQRQLGMTWSPLGMTRAPATLTVKASLRRQR